MAVSFLGLNDYSGGKQLPKGLYAVEFLVKLHQPTKNDGTPIGAKRLGVMANFVPIKDDGTAGGGEAHESFFGFGTKAHESFVPNAAGTGIDQIPGTPGNLSNKSNWFLFLESLYNCGLPQGTVDADISALNGVWVRTDNIPEPEDRKNFKMEAEPGAEEKKDERRGSGLVTVVTEILDEGKPWEGTGGMPTTKKADGRAAGKPIPTKASLKPGPKAVEKPAAKKAADVDYSELVDAAIQAFLGENEDGASRLKVRTAVFKTIKESADEKTAQAAVRDVFDNADSLSNILEAIGYSVQGTNIAKVE
jgi:hypothetical protein